MKRADSRSRTRTAPRNFSQTPPSSFLNSLSIALSERSIDNGLPFIPLLTMSLIAPECIDNIIASVINLSSLSIRTVAAVIKSCGTVHGGISFMGAKLITRLHKREAMNEERDPAFGVHLCSHEFTVSLPFFRVPSLDCFQHSFSGCSELKGITRFPFYIFFFILHPVPAGERKVGFVPGVGGKSSRLCCNNLLSYSSECPRVPARSMPSPPVPVNYTLTNFAFIRGLLIHEVSCTATATG